MIMQEKSSHSINLTLLSSQSISLTTATCNDIWNKNKTFIDKKKKNVHRNRLCLQQICILQKSAFLITNWSSREGILFRSDKTIALKALMIMPSLLLQKTSLSSKSTENSEALKRRFLFLKNKQLDQLMFERKTIQDRLQNNDSGTRGIHWREQHRETQQQWLFML